MKGRELQVQRTVDYPRPSIGLHGQGGNVETEEGRSIGLAILTLGDS